MRPRTGPGPGFRRSPATRQEVGGLPPASLPSGSSLSLGVLGDRLVLVVELVRGADDGGRVDGLEAVVLEDVCDETEEVGARPFLFGIPELVAIA